MVAGYGQQKGGLKKVLNNKMKKLIIIIFSLISLSLYSQLYIDGVDFVMSSGHVTISGIDFKNSGTFTCGTGTINFVGTNDQTILGTSTTTFNNIVINNGNDVITDVDFNVNDELKMTSGELDLQNSVVSLGTTGIIVNETESNRVKVGDPINDIGTITIDRTISPGPYFNIVLGNIGIDLKTDKNLGSITIIRGHQIQYGMDVSESIERYYEIPGIGEITNGNYILMRYFDAELNSLIEGDLIFFQTVSYGTSWWNPCYTTVVLNEATFNDPPYYDWAYEHPITFEDRITLGSKLIPLQVDLISFSYSCENLVIEWSTASEINNDYFTIEKSKDLLNWEYVAKISGNGNSTNLIHYSYPIDNNKVYYRLCQYDYDNTETCYDVIYINCYISDEITVYPNPSGSEAGVTINGNYNSLSIFNALGQIISYGKKGNHITGLAPGIYFFHIDEITIKVCITK